MNNAAPSQTPNVVVENPSVRRAANWVLGVAGIVLPLAVVLDASAPEFDWSSFTAPATAVYAAAAGIFGLAVTLPNVPKR